MTGRGLGRVRTLLHSLATRLTALVRKRSLDAEFDEEIRAHLEYAAEEARARGLSPDEARRAALREFGAIEPMKEWQRDQRTFRWLEFLASDVRYGVRTASRRAGFALLVVAILALGIGSSAAMFGLFDAVLLEELPYSQAERMVRVWETPAPTQWNSTTTLDFLDWKRLAKSFEALSVERLGSMTLVGDEAARIHGWSTSADWFQVYGLTAQLGRVFVEGDDLPGAEPVVVLSNASWRNRFGADPEILGRELRLNDVVHRVVGVLEESSFDRDRGELWRPLLFAEDERTRGYHWLPVVGRLAAGVTLEQAQEEMTSIDAALSELSPAWKRDWGVKVEPFAERHVPSELRSSVPLVFAAVGLVLLIACANVANLLLGRAHARRREFRVRRALGAGSARLVTQQMTETTVLCVAGGVAGVALAYALLQIAQPLWEGMLPATAVVAIDGRVLAFTVAVALASSLLVGLVPALASNTSVSVGPLANRSASRGGERLRRALVVAEVALSMTLLCGAFLLAQSLLRLQAVETGVRTNDVLALSIDLQAEAYRDPEVARTFLRRAREEVASLPGVEAVSFTTDLPLLGVGEGQALLVPGTDTAVSVGYKHIDEHYLKTLGIPVLEGRGPGGEDHAQAQRAVWINEELAEALRTQAQLDQLVGATVNVSTSDFVGKGGDLLDYRIAGVLRSERVSSPGEPNDPVAYVALELMPSRGLKLLVSGSSAEALTPSIRAAIGQVDSRLAIGEVTPLAQLRRQVLSDPRRSAVLVGSFAAAAALLFAIGLYGVVAHMTQTRRREIGVRMALGASVQRVVREVLSAGLALVATGLLAGAALAWALVGTAANLLEGISSLEASSMLLAGSAILLIGSVAAWLPARRAAQTDPMGVLREE